MKIAVSGKGGTGKTTLTAILSKLFVEKGRDVFAVDADPDANLAFVLGFPDASSIVPLVEMKSLIEERTGAKIGERSPFFKLNPKVDDIPDKYFAQHQGIKLAVMGSVRGGGLGCTCPENAFLKALIRHLILEKKDVVILDMEAGIEHLGRGTVEAVDCLIVVVEPGFMSLETAKRIDKLAREIGIRKINVVGNKIREKKDEEFIRDNLIGFDILGFLPFSRNVQDSGMRAFSSIAQCPEMLEEGRKILNALILSKKQGSQDGI